MPRQPHPRRYRLQSDHAAPLSPVRPGESAANATDRPVADDTQHLPDHGSPALHHCAECGKYGSWAPLCTGVTGSCRYAAQRPPHQLPASSQIFCLSHSFPIYYARFAVLRQTCPATRSGAGDVPEDVVGQEPHSAPVAFLRISRPVSGSPISFIGFIDRTGHTPFNDHSVHRYHGSH